MPRKHYDQDVREEETPVVLIQPKESTFIMPTEAASYSLARLKNFQTAPLPFHWRTTLSGSVSPRRMLWNIQCFWALPAQARVPRWSI